MKTRPKRLKKRDPDIWDQWQAKGFTLPPDDELWRLSRGEQVETHEHVEKQLELFPIGGRLVPVDPSTGCLGPGSAGTPT